jgi:hypothetical protein
MRELSYLHSLGLVQLLKIVLLGPEHNPGPAQIVRRQFHRDFVAGKDADIVHPHLARNVAEHHVAVFQLYSKRCIREILKNLALHLYDVVFCHSVCALLGAYRVGIPPLKFALRSSDSYCCDMT